MKGYSFTFLRHKFSHLLNPSLLVYVANKKDTFSLKLWKIISKKKNQFNEDQLEKDDINLVYFFLFEKFEKINKIKKIK